MDETARGGTPDDATSPPDGTTAGSGWQPPFRWEPAGDGEPVVEVLPRHSSRGRVGLIVGRTVVALVSALALLVTGIAWFTLERFKADTHTTNALAEANSGATDLGAGSLAAPPADDGADDILLVGSDSRTDAQGDPLPASVLSQDLRTTYDSGVNTDTIIILRIPDNGGKAYAISIPRDSYVSIPGIGQNKINSAYGLTQARRATQLAGAGLSQQQINQQSDQAGQEALIATVQNLTGIRIDHYAEVSLYGFYLLSKAIGGVPVCLRQATSDKDSGANFAAGPQTVSGAAALSFVRQRENLPNGDLSRIVRQQAFLAAAAKKMLSAGVLANPGTLSGLMDTAHRALSTDPGLDLLTLLQQAQSLASGNVEFVTIPVTDVNGRSPSGQSIVAVDPVQVQRFVAGLVNPAPPAGLAAPGTGHAPAPGQANPPGQAAPNQAAPNQAAPNQAPAPSRPVAPPSVQAPTSQPPTAPVSIGGVPCVD